MSFIELDPTVRDQWQIEIANVLEQPVKRSLVGDRALQCAGRLGTPSFKRF